MNMSRRVNFLVYYMDLALYLNPIITYELASFTSNNFLLKYWTFGIENSIWTV